MRNRVDVLQLLLCLMCWTSTGVRGRQYSKCEFAQVLRKYFVPEEIAAWTCIAEYESGFKTDAVNPSNSDGSIDHGIFQINDRYWCGQGSGSNMCRVDCALLRKEDLSEPVRCARIVRDTQGFTAWTVWPKCKGQTATYLDECNNQRFLPPTIFDTQVKPGNRGPASRQTALTSLLRAFAQTRNHKPSQPDSSLNDDRASKLSSLGRKEFSIGGKFLFRESVLPNVSHLNRSEYGQSMSNVGKLKFLDTAQISGKSHPSPGSFHEAGGKSFLGFPGSRLSFGPGTRSNGETAPTVPSLSRKEHPRYSGISNVVKRVDHAYQRTYLAAAVRGSVHRSGQGILADRGAMNFSRGVQGIPFRKHTNFGTHRTLVVPSVQPSVVNARPKVRDFPKTSLVSSSVDAPQIGTRVALQHLQASSKLLDRRPSLPPTRTHVPRGPGNFSKVIPRPGALVLKGPSKARDAARSDGVVNLGRRVVSTHPVPQTARPSLVKSSRLSIQNARPLPSSASNPALGSSALKRGAVHRSAIPKSSQLQGPVASFSTGTTFFSLGTNAVSSDSSLGSRRSHSTLFQSSFPTTTSRPRFDQSSPFLTYKLSIPRTNFTRHSPQEKNLREAPRVVQSTRFPKTTSTLSNSASIINDGQLRKSKPRAAYGYRPQNSSGKKVKMAKFGNFTAPTPLTTINASQNGSYRNASPKRTLIDKQSGVKPARAASSHLLLPKKRFVSAESPIQSHLLASLPQQVQTLMPDSYGGVSYTMKNGVLITIKHYG